MTTFKDRLIQAYDIHVAEREAEEARWEQEHIALETKATLDEFTKLFGEPPDEVQENKAVKDGVTLVRSRNHKGIWYVQLPCDRCGNPSMSNGLATVADVGRVLKSVSLGEYSSICYDCREVED